MSTGGHLNILESFGHDFRRFEALLTAEQAQNRKYSPEKAVTQKVDYTHSEYGTFQRRSL
jgi:hypothetical protein